MASLRAVAFDSPDAKKLQLAEPMDSSVFELLTRSQQSQTSAGATFFCVQCLLAGANLIAIALLMEYRNSPLDMAGPIVVVEPALGRVTMACSEVSVVASFLRMQKARQAVMSLDFLERSSTFMDDTDVRSRAIWLVLINSIAFITSVGLLLCCLMSGRHDAWLLHGPWDETTGRASGGEAVKAVMDDEDEANQHWLILFVRAVLSFMVVFLALVDIQGQLSFVNPVVSMPPAATQQFGDTKDLRNTASA